MRLFISMIASVFLIGALSGCSKTWSGVKQDSKKAWSSTKQTIHEATAD
ncbi:MAG: entericidin EcnAB [Sulfurimonas sp.]